jgi:hypothetical protein
MSNLLTIILLLICFFLPLNFFIMGENTGYGFQSVLYQYKVSGYGNNMFTLSQDINYVLLGIYSEKTMMSVIFWGIGSIIFIISSIIWIINWDSVIFFNRVSAVMLIISGIFYVVSVWSQYGIFFNGPAGLSIPFGVPLIFIIGYVIFTFRNPRLNEIQNHIQ